jgi:2-oxoglutarate-Fe(II)-dependent oxygenase superfamily protein
VNSAVAVAPPAAWKGIVPAPAVEEVHRIHRAHIIPKIGSGRYELPFSKVGSQADRDFLRELLEDLKRLIVTHFGGDPERHHPDHAVLALLKDGDGHIYHADNVKNVAGRWVPNHTPHRTYSGILYLNTPVQGGEIHFPQHRIQFRPAPGLVVGFPSTGDYVHGVKPVAQGERHAFVFWFSDQEAFRLRG